MMSEDVLNPLVGSAVRLRDKDGLDDFLARPDAESLVQGSSFEQVFFTIKTLGLADALGLLPLVTPRQVCGFVDLDCWRKDTFNPQPFMEWVTAFTQVGPEETVRALGGIDETLVALFLKDSIEVYEIERDEPAPATQLIFSPDNRFAARQIRSDHESTIAGLILDALFKFDPDLGYVMFRKVRYTTRADLEETAYQNKIRRLDVHGFVDYYEALSIYADPESSETVAVPKDEPPDEIPGEDPPQPLPSVFAESLQGGEVLLEALGKVRDRESGRLADELTALGNRILSANLVNLGDVESIRPALEEMRDFLTIGLEHLSGGDPARHAHVLQSSHVQTVFKSGFVQIVQLRNQAEQLSRFPAFASELLESPDREFVNGLMRFKPLLWDSEAYRNFRTLADVRAARDRLETIQTMAEGFLRLFASTDTTLRRTFNTAVVQKAVSGKFEAVPLESGELTRFLDGGMKFPEVPLPEELEPFATIWLKELRTELTPLVGQKVDPRYVDAVLMKL
jgi:hypothetical protein